MYGESCHYGLKIAAIKAPQGFVERGYRKRVEHIYEGGSWTIIDSEEPLGVNLNIKPEL